MNEIEIVVTGRADLGRVENEAKAAGKKIGDGLEKGLDDAAKAGDTATRKIVKDLDKAGDAGKQAGKKIGDGLNSGLSDAMSQLGGTAGNLVGGLVDSIQSGGKAGMLGAGLVVGGVLMAGISRAVEQNKVGAMVAAQTGQTGDAAGRMGDIAGRLFANSFGESVADAGRAVTAVFQEGLIDPGASDAAISELTGKILTVASTVEEESARVARSARTMVVNGVARNVSEALDIIQQGTEKGINTAGDLLDTIDEYSIQFSRAGLSGQEAMGLISQALQGGARDADIAADAIKEFNIRAQDGSETTARGFETIGLNAEEMAAKMASGGKNAHDALRLTLNALQQMPPGVERSTAAVDLFGTKAEDMGDALFDMDLDTAVDEFGNVAGAVDDASKTLGDSIPVWETWGKNLSQVLTDVGTGFTHLRDGFDSFVDSMSGVEGGTAAARAAIQENTGATDENADAQEREAEAVEHSTGKIETQIETLSDWIAKKQEAAGVVLDARDSSRAYQEAIDETTEALAKNGRTHDDNTEAGRDNNEMLDRLAKTALDHADSMDKDGRSVRDVNKHMNDSRARFIAAARAMGYSKDEAILLANKLRLIPKKVTVAVEVRDAAARQNLDMFKRAIDNIPRTITVSTYVRGAAITGSGGKQFLGQAHGGITPAVAHAQEGGARGGGTLINEAGPEVVDLPNGSRVMTAGATRALAERGLLNLDGVLPSETAATGGPRGRGQTAYARTGQVDITAGQHSPAFIQNLLNRGWRAMDGNMNMLYAPWRQARAGSARRWSTGDVTAIGGGHGRLESFAEAAPLTGRHGTPTAEQKAELRISGDADSAVGALFNRLIRDGVIQLKVRS
jgi:hypothetical protein